MLIDYNKPNGLLYKGNRLDYCHLCYEKAIQAKSSSSFAIKNLTGKLEAKDIIKIRKSGTETCICLDCITELAILHNKEKIKEVLTPEIEIEIIKEINEAELNKEVENSVE